MRTDADSVSFCDFRVGLARCRERGLDFDRAWERCVPERRQKRDGVVVCNRDFLEAHRDVWRRAYERMPPQPRERAVAQLAAVLVDEPRDAEHGRLVVR